MGKTVEIDEDVLEQLNRAYNLQKSLHDSDESREAYETALKKKFLDKYRTSSEKAAPLLNPLQEKIDKLEAKLKAREEAEQDDELAEKYKRLKSSGVTDEGLEEIKKIQVEKHIADPEVAWAYFEKRNPPKAIESTGYGEKGWNFTDGADEKGTEAADWFKDPNRMFDKIANEEFSKKRKVA